MVRTLFHYTAWWLRLMIDPFIGPLPHALIGSSQCLLILWEKIGKEKREGKQEMKEHDVEVEGVKMRTNVFTCMQVKSTRYIPL